jgi:hypothetical protein
LREVAPRIPPSLRIIEQNSSSNPVKQPRREPAQRESEEQTVESKISPVKSHANIRVIPTSTGNPKPADGRHPVAVEFTCTTETGKQRYPVADAQLALVFFHDEYRGPHMSDHDLLQVYIDRECTIPYDPAAQPGVHTNAKGQLTLYISCTAANDLRCYVEGSVAEESSAGRTADLDPGIGQRAPLHFTHRRHLIVTDA